MYTLNELFFPHQAIATLRDQRGPAWQALIDRILSLPDTHEETLAFMLMMIRMNGCMSCETDSYRAMRGCPMCAIQSLRRYKGDDNELLTQYQQCLCEIQRYAEANTAMPILREAYRLNPDTLPTPRRRTPQRPINIEQPDQS
jgi:hypothetical protein